MKTASRIANGGKVPSEDEKKLMEIYPEMYAMAKMQAMMAKQHKKYDSLYEKEENADRDTGTESAKMKTYETTMSVSMEGTPQIQEVSEAEVEMDV